MARPKKKVILFIVEGPSDKAALERPIQALLEGNEDGIEVTFLVAENDVTSDFRNNTDNILNKINRWYFEPFFSSNEFYYPKDVIEVVQICDLDGTFLPEEYCKEYDEAHEAKDGFVYDPPYIYGETEDAVKERNRRKAENIKFLLEQPDIKVKSKTKPYSVYFFSTNIDHYLHNELNLCGREKLQKAEKFADNAEKELDLFEEQLNLEECALTNMSYEESWQYIMSETHSIERHTNFNLYIDSLKKRYLDNCE